jgi:ribosomal protein L37AE/L43A
MKTHTCPACQGRQVQWRFKGWWMAIRCAVCGGKGRVPEAPEPVHPVRKIEAATRAQEARLQSALV